MKELILACVGKPSAGKSSFLNAVSNARAKVGNFPFTTIEPNFGIAYYLVKCPCLELLDGRQSTDEKCSPRYGQCLNGVRWIPVKIMDVAGLVPGASEGRGLGNQFLDDLRLADVLMHVVDASGTTDDQGKETAGYDPSGDIDWLNSEIESWIANNLKKTWSGVSRKSKTIYRRALNEGGYGANPRMCNHIVADLPSEMIKKGPESWDKTDLSILVKTFIRIRFPMIIILNKIDMPDSDTNMSKIFQKYKRIIPEENFILTSALAEIFLIKLSQNGYIKYKKNIDDQDTIEPISSKPMDEKMQKRLDKVLDLTFRFNSTGCKEAIISAVECAQMVPVYPLRSINSYAPMNPNEKGSFVDCHLVKKGTPIREYVEEYIFNRDKTEIIDIGIESVGGKQVSENDEISEHLNVFSIKIKTKQDVK